jgi:hypothetical protein
MAFFIGVTFRRIAFGVFVFFPLSNVGSELASTGGTSPISRSPETSKGLDGLLSNTSLLPFRTIAGPFSPSAIGSSELCSSISFVFIEDYQVVFEPGCMVWREMAGTKSTMPNICCSRQALNPSSTDAIHLLLLSIPHHYNITNMSINWVELNQADGPLPIGQEKFMPPWLNPARLKISIPGPVEVDSVSNTANFIDLNAAGTVFLSDMRVRRFT